MSQIIIKQAHLTKLSKASKKTQNYGVPSQEGNGY